MHRQTQWWKVPECVDNYNDNDNIQKAALALSNGELIAFPTESVYGLGANATNEDAVKAIFKAKGRPQDNPLIIHIVNKTQLKQHIKEVPPIAVKLINHFWPGSLTLILEHNNTLAPAVTAGLPTVAVRMPSHPVASALLSLVSFPVAAPSANISSRPSPTLARHVYADLNGYIYGVLDGGETKVGVESTILDVTKDPPVLLRPGGITLEEIEKVVGHVMVAGKIGNEKVIAPGMKYRHYAPTAPLVLIEGELSMVIQYIKEEAMRLQLEGKKVGVLTTEENVNYYKDSNHMIKACGTRADSVTVAQNLFSALRDFDQQNVDIILSESFGYKGIYRSVTNRLTKAAQRIIRI